MNPYRILFLILLSIFCPRFSVASDVSIDMFLRGTYINDCAIDGDYIWCATENHGIIRFDTRDDSWEELIPENAPPADKYLSVAVDRTGVKWFGARTGIYRYDGSLWERFTTGSGQLPYADSVLTVARILVDNNNVLWFADLFNGIASYDGTEWKVISRMSLMDDGAVDPNTNDKWFCGPVVLKYDGEKETIYWAEDVSPTNNVLHLYGIAIDEQSRVWIGGDDLYCYDRAVWTEIFRYVPDIHSMRFDSSGNLILGTYAGLFRYDDGHIVTITALIDDKWFEPLIADIEIAPNGDIWAVTNYWPDDINNALVRYRQKSVRVEDETPLVFEITGVRPNPFNPETVISFSLSLNAPVLLTVYAANGQKVATLVNGPMSAGMHSVAFNGAKLASGVYFYRFESAGLTRTGKMLLLK